MLPPGVFAGRVQITDALIVAGAGADVTIIDGQHQDAVISTDGVDLTLVDAVVRYNETAT